MSFHAYLLRCADGSFYAGHTDDLERRIAQHDAGTMPCYTLTRRPVTLVWHERFGTREEALAAERKIKGWSRAKKEALIAGDWARVSALAKNRQGQAGGGFDELSPNGDRLDAPSTARRDPAEGHPPPHAAPASFDKLSTNGGRESPQVYTSQTPPNSVRPEPVEGPIPPRPTPASFDKLKTNGGPEHPQTGTSHTPPGTVRPEPVEGLLPSRPAPLSFDKLRTNGGQKSPQPHATLVRAAHAAILAATHAAHPCEACGLLLGHGSHIAQAIPTANVAPDPLRHFEIDPAALIAAHRAARAGGPQVLGYFHSHPNGLARPSATDQAQAAGDGRIWAIVAQGAVTLWCDAPSGFAALSYRVADG
ncbi:Mov34/MPN/PAD-1 family protein [Novosphingobium sp.]|uniref:Mov34/MPN/PAD-1 family protein n=1 Tax=Novosphingobium sp. TaxID=1874826 RepID=UPI002FDECF9D